MPLKHAMSQMHTMPRKRIHVRLATQAHLNIYHATQARHVTNAHHATQAHPCTPCHSSTPIFIMPLKHAMSQMHTTPRKRTYI